MPVDVHRRMTLRMSQNSDGLADLFRLAQCPVCGSFSGLETSQSNDLTCKTCNAEIAADSARDCYVPMGFVTDFVETTDKDDDKRVTRSSRTSTAEARSIQLQPVSRTNLEMNLDHQLYVYRLNRGEWRDTDWTGFEAEQGSLELRVRTDNTRIRGFLLMTCGLILNNLLVEPSDQTILRFGDRDFLWLHDASRMHSCCHPTKLRQV